MATGFGFCPNCGAARSAEEQKFCASCGAGVSATAMPAAPPVTPAAPQMGVTPPPPAPTWATPPVTPAALQMGVTPPPPAPTWATPPPPPAWAAPGSLPPAPAFSAAAPGAATSAKSKISPTMVLIGVILIAAICGGAYLVTNNGSKSSGPGSSNGPAAVTSASLNVKTSQPGATGQTGGNSGLSGAVSALSDINSYKFSMTLAGGEFGSMLSTLGGAGASGDAPFTISGTIVEKPTAAADITMAGFHIIEVGGNDYLDMSGSGSFISYPASGTSMADSFAPSTMFSSMMDPSTLAGFTKVGTEQKNGVSADHYQGTPSAPITTRAHRQRFPVSAQRPA
jgi:hypothetical protein